MDIYDEDSVAINATSEIFRGRKPRRAGEPKGLTQNGLAAFKEIVQKGCFYQLMLRGGTRVDMSLDASKTPQRILRGRLWERYPKLPALEFTEQAFAVLCAVLSNGDGPVLKGSGDELFWYLATKVHVPERHVGATLAWLGGFGVPPEPERMESFLHDPAGPVLIEALTPDFTRAWITIERSKATIKDPAQLARLGEHQEAGLNAYLDIIDRMGRRDLASFIVDAGQQLLNPRATPEEATKTFLGNLDTKTSLGLRQRAKHAAGAFLRMVARVGKWHNEHRYTRPFEEEYPVCQAITSRWTACKFDLALPITTALEAL
jgi:hypothetical protein